MLYKPIYTLKYIHYSAYIILYNIIHTLYMMLYNVTLNSVFFCSILWSFLCVLGRHQYLKTVVWGEAKYTGF